MQLPPTWKCVKVVDIAYLRSDIAIKGASRHYAHSFRKHIRAYHWKPTFCPPAPVRTATSYLISYMPQPPVCQLQGMGQ